MKHKFEQHFTKRNIITAFLLVAFAVIGRLVLQEYPNIETLMVVTVIAGATFGPYLGLLVALLSIVGTDMIIGNTSILMYTWTAWLAIGVASTLLKRNKNKVSVWLDTLKYTAGGAFGTLFFYAWTNFGVWHLSGMYPHTFEGLMQSYVMALPFLRNQFFGNMIIVPLGAFTFLTVLSLVLARSEQRSSTTVTE